jgi:hypothetical protein
MIEPASIVTGPLVILGETEGEPDPSWWMSFCDPAKAPPRRKQRPGGPSFLGVVIVQAPSLEDAITWSHLLGVNPGGQIEIVGPIPAGMIGAEWHNRLLNRAEAESIQVLGKPQ